MAVRIRLQKYGSKHVNFFRIVAAESTRSRDGKFLALLGTYDAHKGLLDVDQEAANQWYRHGALPTESVKSLFKKYKVFLTKIKVEKSVEKKEVKKQTVAKKQPVKKEPAKPATKKSVAKAEEKKPVAKKQTTKK